MPNPWQTIVKIHIPVLEEFNLPSPAGINYSIQTVALGASQVFLFFFQTCWAYVAFGGNYGCNRPRDRFEVASVGSTPTGRFSGA